MRQAFLIATFERPKKHYSVLGLLELRALQMQLPNGSGRMKGVHEGALKHVHRMIRRVIHLLGTFFGLVRIRIARGICRAPDTSLDPATCH